MTNEKFTLGEWWVEIDVEDNRPYILCGDIQQEIIADVFVPNQSIEQCNANAALIAAAPDMYRMLKYLADGVRYGGIQHTDKTLAAEIENLLKKARGEE